MRRYKLLAVIFVCVLCSRVQAQSHWVAQQSPLDTEELGKIQFVSPTEGWITTGNGRLLHTMNSGTSWDSQSLSPTDTISFSAAPSHALSFVNANTGWVVGSLGTLDAPHGAVLFKTTDAGLTWQRSVIGSWSAGLAAYFINGTTGWVSVMQANTPGLTTSLLRTTDGGASWSTQFSSPSKLFVNCFVDANNGWMESDSLVFDIPGQRFISPSEILHTTNGGATWTSQYRSGSGGVLQDIHFSDANNGWAVGTDNVILHTTNGGSAWSQVNNTGVDPVSEHKCVFAFDGDHAWIGHVSHDTAGQTNSVLHTTNGGVTWTVEVVPVKYEVFSIFFHDANNGWLSADYGGIARYSAGADTTPPSDTCTGANLTISNVVPWLVPSTVELALIDTSGQPGSPVKICADGSASTILTLSCTHGKQKGSDVVPTFVEHPDSASGGWFDAPVVTSESYAWTYHHPQFLASSDTIFHLTFELIDTIHGNNSVVKFPIEIYRAPLVLVHGIAADASEMSPLANNVIHVSPMYPSGSGVDNALSGSDSPLIFFADYGSTVNDGFAANASVVPDAVTRALQTARQQGFSAGRVDVVAHSMGGVLARMFVQRPQYHGEVNRLITANTPHSGTQLATWVARHRDLFTGALAPLKEWFREGGLDIDGDAIRDLDATGTAILSDLNGTSLNRNVVPSYALSASIKADSTTIAPMYGPSDGLLNFLTMYKGIVSALQTGSELFGELSDWFVPLTSQSGGLHTVSTVTGQNHSSMGSASMQNDIRSALSGIPDATCDTTGFHPPILPYTFGATQKSSGFNIQSVMGSSITITSPAPSDSLTPGHTLNVQFSSTSNIHDATMFVTCGNHQLMSQPVSPSSGTASFQIPSDAFGSVNILVVSADGSGVNGLDTVKCGVRVSAALVSMTPSPKRIFLRAGETKSFAVRGTFADGSTPDVSADSTMVITPRDPSVVRVVGPGKILGLKNDTTSLNLVYRGQSAVVFVTVNNPDSIVPVRESRPVGENTPHLGALIAYPNPSVTMTTVGMYVPHSEPVRVVLTDMLGNTIATIVRDHVDQGYHEFQFRTDRLKSGVYMCVLTAGGEMRKQAVVVVK